MRVGRYTYGVENIRVAWGESAHLSIGSFCSIAENVVVYLGGNHRTDRITTYPFGHINEKTFPFPKDGHPVTRGDVIIGNDVWIGGNVTIMSGVRIGDGAVIARNSHVVSNVKPYAVVGGNPAQLYYFRFSSDIIKRLLEIKWWNLPEETIKKLLPNLCSSDTQWLHNY